VAVEGILVLFFHCDRLPRSLEKAALIAIRVSQVEMLERPSKLFG
jgi:hypothetical protein